LQHGWVAATKDDGVPGGMAPLQKQRNGIQVPESESPKGLGFLTDDGIVARMDRTQTKKEKEREPEHVQGHRFVISGTSQPGPNAENLRGFSLRAIDRDRHRRENVARKKGEERAQKGRRMRGEV
jgi:hypothetical protein